MSDPESACVISLDIGGSKIMAALVSGDGRILRTLPALTASTAAALRESNANRLCFFTDSMQE